MSLAPLLCDSRCSLTLCPAACVELSLEYRECKDMDCRSGSWEIFSKRTTDVCVNTSYPVSVLLALPLVVLVKVPMYVEPTYPLDFPRTRPHLLFCFQSQSQSALGTHPTVTGQPYLHNLTFPQHEAQMPSLPCVVKVPREACDTFLDLALASISLSSF